MVINVDWQRAYRNFLGAINDKYPKREQLQLIKPTGQILPLIINRTPISGPVTFYPDGSKLGMAAYKAGNQ